MPDLFIIAKCNGAGKTTAAFNLLPNVFEAVEFVNADEIARGLSPLNIEGVAFQASRIMLERIKQLINEKESFAFETTLSGLSYFNYIKEAKVAGYNIIFFFVYLDSIELAKNRVAIRVSKGGHNIPEDVISRRYLKGLRNFVKYAEIADDWYLYNNSGTEYELVAKCILGNKEITNFDTYNKVVSYEFR
jgi:predicted ABC-type ATPase